MQLEMMEYAMKNTKRLLRKKHPHLSKREITIEFIKTYYKHNFSEEDMESIVEWMKMQKL